MSNLSNPNQIEARLEQAWRVSDEAGPEEYSEGNLQLDSVRSVRAFGFQRVCELADTEIPAEVLDIV